MQIWRKYLLSKTLAYNTHDHDGILLFSPKCGVTKVNLGHRGNAVLAKA